MINAVATRNLMWDRSLGLLNAIAVLLQDLLREAGRASGVSPPCSHCELSKKPFNVLFLFHFTSRFTAAASFCRARKAVTLTLDGFQPVRSQISTTDFSSR